MPADTVTTDERVPRPGRYLIPGETPRRAELIAACAVLAVVAHLLFAQLTLILAIAFYLITRLTRWRPQWLAVPACIGMVWVLALGPAQAASGFAEGPAQIAAYLGGAGHDLGRLAHMSAAYSGIGRWLPRQFPVALIAASAEAAIAAWLSWLHTDEWKLPGYRPGLVTFCRRWYLTRFISSGGVVTRDGACLGLDAATGGRVAVSWAEVAGGVLCAGSAGSGTTTTSFQIVHAAIRRRKPVIAVDLDGSRKLAESLRAVCAATGTPLHQLPAEGSGYYDPLRTGDPARRTSLVMGMLDWEGTADQYRRGCAAYLTDLFTVADAAPGDPRTAMLDDVVHLLSPAALRARMDHVPGYYPRRRALGERVKVSAGLLDADPRTTATLAEQLNELRSSPLGRWLRPAPGPRVDLGRVVRERAVVLFSIESAAHGRAATTMAGLIARDVLAVCSELRRIGVPADGLAWFDRCGGLALDTLDELVARGGAAGLPALLTTTAAERAQPLAGQVNVLVLHRLTDPAAAGRFAALTGQKFAPAGSGDLAVPAGSQVRPEAAAPGGPDGRDRGGRRDRAAEPARPVRPGPQASGGSAVAEQAGQRRACADRQETAAPAGYAGADRSGPDRPASRAAAQRAAGRQARERTGRGHRGTQTQERGLAAEGQGYVTAPAARDERGSNGGRAAGGPPDKPGGAPGRRRPSGPSGVPIPPVPAAFRQPARSSPAPPERPGAPADSAAPRAPRGARVTGGLIARSSRAARAAGEPDAAGPDLSRLAARAAAARPGAAAQAAHPAGAGAAQPRLGGRAAP